MKNKKTLISREKVAIVGNKINDASALAIADAGIAVRTGTPCSSRHYTHGDLNSVVNAVMMR